MAFISILVSYLLVNVYGAKLDKKAKRAAKKNVRAEIAVLAKSLNVEKDLAFVRNQLRSGDKDSVKLDFYND